MCVIITHTPDLRAFYAVNNPSVLSSTRSENIFLLYTAEGEVSNITSGEDSNFEPIKRKRLTLLEYNTNSDNE